jgi:thiol-disulfide isomerase/thioredoxin
MKKLLIPIFIIIVICFVFCIQKQKTKNKEREKTYQNFHFNDFEFLHPIQQNELNENTVICFFSSTCGLCSYEAELLVRNKENIPENLDFIFVSAQKTDSIQNFINRNKLSNEAHFYFAKIDSALLIHKYGVSRYPRGIIYKNDLLCDVYKGVIELDRIKNKLNKTSN